MAASLTEEELARLEALEAAATPGPWCWSDVGEKGNEWCLGTAVDDNDAPIAGHLARDDGTPVDYVCEAGSSGNLQDPALIAAMRNALPALLASARREQKAKQAVDRLADFCTRAKRFPGLLTGAHFVELLERSLTATAEPTAGTPRLCPGCRSLDGEHDFGVTCTVTEPTDGEER